MGNIKPISQFFRNFEFICGLYFLSLQSQFFADRRKQFFVCQVDLHNYPFHHYMNTSHNRIVMYTSFRLRSWPIFPPHSSFARLNDYFRRHANSSKLYLTVSSWHENLAPSSSQNHPTIVSPHPTYFFLV